jgi:hypothetical protein
MRVGHVQKGALPRSEVRRRVLCLLQRDLVGLIARWRCLRAGSSCACPLDVRIVVMKRGESSERNKSEREGLPIQQLSANGAVDLLHQWDQVRLQEDCLEVTPRRSLISLPLIPSAQLFSRRVLLTDITKVVDPWDQEALSF